MEAILEGLNEQQREAVLCTDGPVLIIAGAGSGKTKVITTRISHLLNQGVPPYRILAMTFTNKAAKEMKHRVERAVGTEARDLTITTFHTFCARFLRREISYLDRESNFAIYDSSDQTACLKRVIRSMNLVEKEFPATKFRNKFSYIKNSGSLDPEPEDETERTIFHAYRKEMLNHNALDFDDLMLDTCRILDRFSEVRERYRNRYQYIMVDEYQDTNKVQAHLINLLLNEDRNLCVVGDEDQSIYGWRGAEIANILDFDKHYAGAKVYKLEQNYRSTQSILDYANRVIARNDMRKDKKLWTAAGEGEAVKIRDERSSRSEAEFIVQKIASLARSKSLSYDRFAILFRSNYLSRGVEDMCRRYRIPYQLIGGLKFYDRKEIKDLLSFMRIVVNPRDWVSFQRAIATPPRGVGAKSLDKMFAAFQSGGSLLSVIKHTIDTKLIGGRGLKGLKEFRDLYEMLLELKDEITPAEWLSKLVEELDYMVYLNSLDEATAEFREGNIDELLEGMAELEDQGVVTLSQFMDFSALVTDLDDLDEREPKVNLMTIHAAKGLEFDTVFVMGLEDGVFPNQRSMYDNPNALEEERRLFYVAVTRAEQRLFLTYARQRQTFGTTNSNPKSRFLLTPFEGDDLDRAAASPDVGAPTSQFSISRKSKYGSLEDQMRRMKSQLADQGRDAHFGGLDPDGFKRGDRVSHPKFGKGKIKNVTGSGTNQTLVVVFPDYGVKTLVARMAKLTKL